MARRHACRGDASDCSSASSCGQGRGEEGERATGQAQPREQNDSQSNLRGGSFPPCAAWSRRVASHSHRTPTFQPPLAMAEARQGTTAQPPPPTRLLVVPGRGRQLQQAGHQLAAQVIHDRPHRMHSFIRLRQRPARRGLIVAVATALDGNNLEKSSTTAGNKFSKQTAAQPVWTARQRRGATPVGRDARGTQASFTLPVPPQHGCHRRPGPAASDSGAGSERGALTRCSWHARQSAATAVSSNTNLRGPTTPCLVSTTSAAAPPGPDAVGRGESHTRAVFFRECPSTKLKRALEASRQQPDFKRQQPGNERAAFPRAKATRQMTATTPAQPTPGSQRQQGRSPMCRSTAAAACGTVRTASRSTGAMPGAGRRPCAPSASRRISCPPRSATCSGGGEGVCALAQVPVLIRLRLAGGGEGDARRGSVQASCQHARSNKRHAERDTLEVQR